MAKWLAAAAAVLLVATGGAVIYRSRSADAPPRFPNVLVITVDTLRADHLPAYGYVGAETPAIDRIAREGVRFEAAYTPVPMTLPAHASLFTGLLPGTHGIRDNGSAYLQASDQTLATVLKGHGYETAAFVSAFVLDSRWGLAQGFDEYFDQFDVTIGDLSTMARVQRPAAETWARAQPWLNARTSQPFFLWLHFFDPHAPYAAPEPFGSRHTAQPYDGEIAYVDSVVQEVFDALEAKALLDDTILVFASDHGEGLGQHDEDEHALLMYDSTLRVPWIMRLPQQRRAGTVVRGAVSLVDVFPTILDLAGVSVPAGIDGATKTRAIEMETSDADGGEAVVYSESYYPRRFGWSELTGVRRGPLKYIRAPQPELYDAWRDPGETMNLAAQRPEDVAALDRLLSSFQTRRATPPASDPAAMARLRALGYVSASTSLVAHGRELPDPKDKTHVFRSLTSAQAALEHGREREGIQTLQRLIVQDPAFEAAHRALREYWIGRRMFREGIAWLETALQQRPTDPELLLDLASLYHAEGQWPRASAAVDTLLARRPEDPDALVLHGQLLRETGRPDEALAAFGQAVRHTSAPTPVNLQIARTQIVMRRLSEAEATLGTILAVEPQTAGAHYLLAQAAEARGDSPRAEREYRAELASHPWDYQTLFNLAQLVGARGDYREQARLLRSIPKLAPMFHDVHFYLAKALLDIGDPALLSEAVSAAIVGLKQAPTSPVAPLGHYVLADIYRLQGRPVDAEREVQRGRALERRTTVPPS